MKFNFAHLVPGRTAAPAQPAAPAATPAGTPGQAADAPAAQPAAPAPAADLATQVRQEERTRCATIFASPSAAGRVEMAATLAFGTDLTAEQAVAVLETAPTAATPAAVPANPFAAAMAAIPNPQVGTEPGGGDADDPQALVAQILKAGV